MPRIIIYTINTRAAYKKLLYIGYEAYIPRTISWSKAFAYTNDKSAAYILIGKREIFIKYYSEARDTKLDETGRLYTDNGQLIRNKYHKSGINLHLHILDFSLKFLANLPIEEVYLISHGEK